MTWQTHAAVGANSAWIAALAGTADERLLLLAGAGAVAALLPDIDATGAKVHFAAGGSLGMFRGIFRHRHFFHSILATTLLYFVAGFFLRPIHVLLPEVIALGYLSHLLIDGCNMTGVRLFFPATTMISLLPKSLRSRVKGPMDQLLFILGVAGIGLLAFSHLDLFMLSI